MPRFETEAWGKSEMAYTTNTDKAQEPASVAKARKNKQ